MALAAALLAMLVCSGFGCTATVTPPFEPEDPVRVFLLSEAMHTGLVLPPDPGDVELVDGIIYKELMLGRVTRDAERALKTVITMKEKQGAQAIVLACTELELVVDTDANVLPVYDSTDIHCRAAADWILG